MDITQSLLSHDSIKSPDQARSQNPDFRGLAANSFKCTQTTHHRENWQQLPTSIAKAVDKILDNIRPPRPTESAGDLTSVSADHDQVDFDPVDGAFTQLKSRSKRSKKTTKCQ